MPYVLVRYHFNTHVSRPLLTGNRRKYKVNRHGDVIKDKLWKERFDTDTRTKGCIEPSFIAKHYLSHKTKTEYFVGLFLPFGKNQQGNKEMVSFELLTKWTNLKSTLAGAGKGGTYYTDCVPLSVEEIREYVGLYVFHGLLPSPRIEFKFRSQHKDKFHRNYFIRGSFGPNAECLSKHLKAFFSCQNPAIDTPDRSEYPNLKVRHLLTWMNIIFPTIWLLSLCFSIDVEPAFIAKHHMSHKTKPEDFVGLFLPVGKNQQGNK